MSVQAVTHLNFQGQARAALAFYQQVFGGQLMQFTYRDAGRTANEAELDLIVWGQVEAGHGCPVSMTYAAVPALRTTPDLAARRGRKLAPVGASAAMRSARNMRKSSRRQQRASTTSIPSR